MSYLFFGRLVCSEVGCRHMQVSTDVDVSERIFIERAKGAGWRVVGDQWHCPQHRPNVDVTARMIGHNISPIYGRKPAITATLQIDGGADLVKIETDNVRAFALLTQSRRVRITIEDAEAAAPGAQNQS